MRILIDVSHPAHVHLFRHAIACWKDRGHDVVVTARRKDVTQKLLEFYNIEHTIVSEAIDGLIGLARGLFEHDYGVYQVARQHKSDVLVGTSVAASHAAKLLGKKSIIFNEDNIRSSPAFALLAYPFATLIATPDALVDDLGRKHIKYASYQELAYLHPNQFSADSSIRQELNLDSNQAFSIVRFVSLKASHDMGQKGLSNHAKRTILKLLSEHGRVFISSEAPLPSELEAYQLPIPVHRIHDALAHASMFVGDSQSMTIEAAVLGTPALRCNSFVGKTPVIEELENRYELTYGFLPQQEEQLFSRAKALLSNRHLEQDWQIKRKRMLAEKIELTPWIVSIVENGSYPD